MTFFTGKFDAASVLLDIAKDFITLSEGLPMDPLGRYSDAFPVSFFIC